MTAFPPSMPADPSSASTPPRPGRVRALVWALLLVLAPAACGDDGAAPEADAATLPAERFVAAYVALREAALLAPGQELTDSARAAVLAARGVTEEELVRFVEARGDEVGFMQGVWAEVSRRLEERRVHRDSLPPASGSPEAMVPRP